MIRALATVVAMALILPACRRNPPFPQTSTEAKQLRWLDHADVIADFTERVEKQHDLRFASVYAFSTAGALGLAETPELKELLQKHGERHIEGTTDIVTSAEHRRLLQKASDYVKQYNILLLHYLHEHPNA